eukprot:489055-Prymnesium_polylepis.1
MPPSKRIVATGNGVDTWDGRLDAQVGSIGRQVLLQPRKLVLGVRSDAAVAVCEYGLVDGARHTQTQVTQPAADNSLVEFAGESCAVLVLVKRVAPWADPAHLGCADNEYIQGERRQVDDSSHSPVGTFR